MDGVAIQLAHRRQRQQLAEDLAFGDIIGPTARNSRYQVSMPSEFFIVVSEGTSANEYQCVSMSRNDKQCEFRIMTVGIVMEGTTDKNFVYFEAEKVAPRLYRVDLTQLEPGEYGFVPPGASMQSSKGSVGKIYSFEVR